MGNIKIEFESQDVTPKIEDIIKNLSINTGLEISYNGFLGIYYIITCCKCEGAFLETTKKSVLVGVGSMNYISGNLIWTLQLVGGKCNIDLPDWVKLKWSEMILRDDDDILI